MLVSRNLTVPFKEIILTLRGITNGRFDKKVKVTTNDEIGYTGDVINEMTEGLREGEVIKDAFGKYVAHEIRDEVLSGRIPLDGEKKDVTVLFSDLRDFTPMTESNDPKLVIKIMNSYFKEMAEAIQDQGGLVLQFIGDEIYAVFGAPISRPDHPDRAFQAGLEMGRRLFELNRDFEKKGWPYLRHGIGIHTGEAIAANIGSPDRLSYLLVGDTINLASRLQSLTKEIGKDMIISSATYTRLTESEKVTAELKQLPPTTVKGKKHPVGIFAVASSGSHIEEGAWPMAKGVKDKPSN
jgi:adenylate cyclase